MIRSLVIEIEEQDGRYQGVLRLPDRALVNVTDIVDAHEIGDAVAHITAEYVRGLIALSDRA